MTDRSASTHTRLWVSLLCSAGILAIAVRVWAATQWSANFQSDEAIFALMARHILAGEFTPTNYGPPNFGSIESIVAAGFIRVLGPSVLAFRLGAIVLFAGFLALHAILTTRYFGYPIALVSLLFLALPGFHVLSWTYQPIGAYAALLLLGTAILLLSEMDARNGRTRLIKFVGIGLLIGAGVWSNHEVAFYVIPLALVQIVGSSEWRTVRTSLAEFAKRVILIPLSQLMPVVLLGVLFLCVLAFFSDGCNPAGLYAQVRMLARLALGAVIACVAGWALYVSRRRLRLTANLGLVSLGFVCGFSPSLYNWIIEGNRPYWAVYPSCPTGVFPRANLMLKQIIPSLWGIPTWDRLQGMSGGALVPWGVIAALVLAAIGSYIWWNRLGIWASMTASPPEGEGRRGLMLTLLFGLPILISLLASNTVDVHSIRHMLVSVQASAIIFAVFLIRLFRRARPLALILGAFWLVFVGATNLSYANSNWSIKFTRYDPDAIVALEDALKRDNIRYGYADYWGAYTLDYLLEEQVIIAPFNGIDRYPRYSSEAASSPKLAFIFPASNAPSPTGRMEELKAFLSDAENQQGEGAARSTVRDRLRGRNVRTMRHVADWDVWIVVDN